MSQKTRLYTTLSTRNLCTVSSATSLRFSSTFPTLLHPNSFYSLSHTMEPSCYFSYMKKGTSMDEETHSKNNCLQMLMDAKNHNFLLQLEESHCSSDMRPKEAILGLSLKCESSSQVWNASLDRVSLQYFQKSDGPICTGTSPVVKPLIHWFNSVKIIYLFLFVLGAWPIQRKIFSWLMVSFGRFFFILDQAL